MKRKTLDKVINYDAFISRESGMPLGKMLTQSARHFGIRRRTLLRRAARRGLLKISCCYWGTSPMRIQVMP